ncbi:hypothetical protein L7F22_038221 [Adiantum nelumboides]|nr:hypothetical protein [Adiantum nelumboides]
MLRVMAMAPKNAVNAYDEEELLSHVEKESLLSKAESAGLTLSSIEKMGLLSKAEDLCLLTFAVSFAISSPQLLASLSLPFIVLAIVTLVVILDDSTTLIMAHMAFAVGFSCNCLSPICWLYNPQWTSRRLMQGKTIVFLCGCLCSRDFSQLANSMYSYLKSQVLYFYLWS